MGPHLTGARVATRAPVTCGPITKRPITRAHTTRDGMSGNRVFRVKTVKNCLVTAGVEPAIPCMGGRSAHHHAAVAAAGILCFDEAVST